MRPTIDALAGARAAVNGLTAGGVFNGSLAPEADAAERRIG